MCLPPIHWRKNYLINTEYSVESLKQSPAAVLCNTEKSTGLSQNFNISILDNGWKAVYTL